MPTEPNSSKWVVYPPSPEAPFAGFFTHDDPSRVPDLASPNGQNTTSRSGDRITIRDLGFDIFPATASLSAITEPSRSMWTFHRRDGEQILVVARGSDLLWFDEASQSFANLGDAYTSDDFGFAEMNVNTDSSSYLYFGNGEEAFSRWTGTHASLVGALAGGEVTVTVDSTTLFPSSGTVRIGTTDVTYTGKTATQFTGCVGVPAAANGAPVAQAVQEYAANPKGNVYMAADNRLFVAGVDGAEQAIWFSAYADATDFVGAVIVTSSTADSPGIFNLVEGGGGVTAMAQDEGTLYFFKENITYAARLTDSLYSLVPLKPFDGRSQTTGARTKRSVFVGGNRVFFVSKDSRIYALQRVETIDYPQMVPISHAIQPTVDSFSFDAVSGIVYRDNAFFACKSSPTAPANDVLLAFDLNAGTWAAPYTNFNASEFAVYLTGGVERLLYGDSLTSNVWRFTETPVDYVYDTAASWKTKPYDFGQPAGLKELDSVFVEGYVASNTNLSINLLLDDGGSTQYLTTALSGTETDYLFQQVTPNAFGLLPFGTERFGTNTDLSGKKKFRVFLNKNLRRTPFFTAQLEFASSGSGQAWEVLRYGFLVRQHSQPVPTKLMRDW